MTEDDDDSLLGKVHQAIQAGDLPNRLPDRVWGGPATSDRCAVCGGPMRGGIEFELVFTDDCHVVEQSCYVHDRCRKVFERAVQGLSGRAISMSSQAGDIGLVADSLERQDAS